MGLIAGASALVLFAKTTTVIAGISAKIIVGARLYKTLRQDKGFEKKPTTEEDTNSGKTP